MIIDMRKIFITFVPIILIGFLYEVCGIFFSKSKVSDLCSDNVIPVIYSKKDWENWKVAVRSVAPEGVNNESQRKLLGQLAHEKNVSMKSFAGYPYNYPYSGVWALREEIWINEKKVASWSIYQSQNEMGPIQRSIFGGNIGSIYGCINNKKFEQIFSDIRAHEFIGIGNVNRYEYGWRW